MRSYVLAGLAVAIVACLVQYASAGSYGGQRQVYSTYQAQPRRVSRFYKRDYLVYPGGQVGGAGGGYYGGAMSGGYGGYGGIGRRGGLFGLSWMWILLILFLLFFLLNDK